VPNDDTKLRDNGLIIDPGIADTIDGAVSDVALSADYHAFGGAAASAEIEMANDIDYFLKAENPFWGSDDWNALAATEQTNSDPGTIIDTAASGDTRARWRINTDGRWGERADVVDSNTYTYYNWMAGTSPGGGIDAEFEIKWVKVSGDTVNFGSAWPLENTYYDIDGNTANIWIVLFANQDVSTPKEAVFDITLRCKRSGGWNSGDPDTQRFFLRVLQS